MYQNDVIPARCAPPAPESRPFNRSCNPYLNLDSRFTVRPAGCPGMTKRGFTLHRHSELTLCPLGVSPESCNPGSNDSVSESSKKGFTLIELLVVVLIIGILSAVALPQYTKAVEKSRAAEAMVILNGIANANKVYQIANGSYAEHIDELDIEIPGEDKVFNSWRRKQSKNYQFGTRAQSVSSSIALANRLPFGSVYFLYIDEGKSGVYCQGYSAKGTEICRMLSGGKKEGNYFVIGS